LSADLHGRSRVARARRTTLRFDLRQSACGLSGQGFRAFTVGRMELIMSDLQLRKDVLDELEYEPSVNAAHIGVAVDKGIVTLSGHVSNYAEKTVAVTVVRRVKGVRAIADEVEVRYPSDKKTADDEIAKRAIDILSWDTMIPRDSIQVTVRDGLVTLSGNVDWYYQKTVAEEDVRKLSGVRDVIDNIEIRPRIRADDVKRKIEDALRRHAEVEARLVRVTVVDNDKVLLEGKVDNWDERRAVEMAAWSAPGVRLVEDRLTIS
jgi:osmotically-inducible protein OsmY